MKHISTTVYMTQSQVLDLKRLSRRTKVPQSVIIRDGIDKAIAYWEERAEREQEVLASMEGGEE